MRYLRLVFAIFTLIYPLVFLWSGDKKPIEVLLTSDNSIYEQALFGIQTSINREIHINYLDLVESENENIATYFQDLEGQGVPLIITIGKGATHAAQEHTNKIPIVFSMLSHPKGLDLESPRICGVSLDVPVDSFLSTLKDIYPDAKSVYSFFSNTEGEFVSDEGEHVDMRNKLLFKKKKTSVETFKKDLNDLAKFPDAIFIPTDPLYNSENFETVSKFSKDHSIILMSSFPALVKSGATFGITPDYTKIGIETGEMANLILENKSSCEKERVHLPKHFNFLLNEAFAKESKISIPPSIQERAKKSKLFSVGLQLLNEEKWKSSKAVFESVLKNDPANQSAIAYQQLALEKLSGTQTKDILAKAKANFEAGNFALAKQEYQKALNINPNLTSAKEGILQSSINQSEKDRARAAHLKNNGQIYEAIRAYLESLRTYPANNQSKMELDSIRKSEFSHIPALSHDGINSYQNRDYDIAIMNFEKILLLDPIEKTASEYLRLSIKKREALRNLEKRQRKSP